ncbi:TPA: hypothetical protein N0F65_008900 [Lagenidium giganteum]|uniref:Uncharacterized protein n=1 Tax=Lagenidium giganteum TaxID=4803 RepID=A0AAV2YYD2_9STRA|nr:TPA: hypothetical protein N0F65_008900 [Lagenidium giganteum]
MQFAKPWKCLFSCIKRTGPAS